MEILERQAEAAGRNELKAIITISPENVAYTAGFPVPSQQIPIRERFFACVVAQDGRTCMLVADMEESQARSDSRISDIVSYNEWTEDPVDILANILREHGAEAGAVGIELDFLPAKYKLRLDEALPNVHFVNCEEILGDLRMIKTAEEIETMRRIGRIAENAHYQAVQDTEPGATEMDLALGLYDALLRGGAESIRMVVVGSGERSQHANPGPTDREMLPGELVRVDIYATENGYLSDVARTMVIGEPTDEQKRVWEVLKDVQDKCLAMIRPGAETADIYRYYAEQFEEAGLSPLKFLGHGLGLTLHEGPYINEYTNAQLQEGMVLCIEPFHILTGVEGYQLEDEVLVTADGCELLTDQYSSEALIQIG